MGARPSASNPPEGSVTAGETTDWFHRRPEAYSRPTVPSRPAREPSVAGGDDLPGSYYTAGGTRYYYVETTGEGWGVGEVPEGVQNQGARADLQPLDDGPILALEWQTRGVPGELQVALTIHNVGSQTATNVQGQIDVIDGSGNAVEQDRTSYPTLPTGSNSTQELTLDVPTDQELRLRLGALLDGTVNDLSETEMHSP